MSTLVIFDNSTHFFWCCIGLDWKCKHCLRYTNINCVRGRRTNFELAFHPLFVFLPVLLLYLLVGLNGLDEFRLDQRGLFDYHAESHKVRNDAAQKNPCNAARTCCFLICASRGEPPWRSRALILRLRVVLRALVSLMKSSSC